MNLRTIHRAILSVSDKTGIIEFARSLQRFGVEIISTGGTLRALQEAQVKALSVSDITGFPEILDGRVKTLHPNVHAGILAIHDNPQHRRQLEQHKITPIDMVVVNLYPFEQTIARSGISLDEAIEQIDIGGPAMTMASAKNWHSVAALTSSAQYRDFISALKANNGMIGLQQRFIFAAEAMKSIGDYRTAIGNYFSSLDFQKDVLPHLSVR